MFDRTILAGLLHNETYARKVIPHLNKLYFDDIIEQTIFGIIEQYFHAYNRFPSQSVLKIELEGIDNLNEQQFKHASQLIQTLNDNQDDTQWLIDRTEQFCQQKAIYRAIRDSILIIDDKSQLSKNAIPDILQQALSVTFNTNIGHDFLEDWDARYDYLTKKVKLIPFDIDYLNRITGGGIPPKTLSCIMAGCVHPNTKVKVRIKKNLV